MSRDLLYKPQVPILQPEEETKSKVDKPKDRRDLGTVGQTPGQEIAQKQAQAPAGKPQAFKAAYFNQDISGVRDVNLRQSNAQALRGGEGATDLKKITLPPSALGISTPDPMQLRGASDLMGLDGSFELSLESMLGRQSAWTKGKGVTVEMIQERMKRLEQMVADRKRALARLTGRVGKKAAASVTIDQAVTHKGAALDDEVDVVTEGKSLIHKTLGQAEGMHMRMAKALGIKRT